MQLRQKQCSSPPHRLVLPRPLKVGEADNRGHRIEGVLEAFESGASATLHPLRLAVYNLYNAVANEESSFSILSHTSVGPRSVLLLNERVFGTL